MGNRKVFRTRASVAGLPGADDLGLVQETAAVSRASTRTDTQALTETADRFGIGAVVGASVNYGGHPTITASGLRAGMDFYDGQLSASIVRDRPILAGPHGYSGASYPSSFPTALSSSAVSWASTDGYSYAWLNIKTGGVASWADQRDGAFSDRWTGLLQSVPSNVIVGITSNHEPENDATQPNVDGGTWENTNGPIWCRGQAVFADIAADLDLPNVYYFVCHQSDTFPTNGAVGGKGINQRNPENWNCWQYMGAKAKKRTVLAPDGYTKMTSTGFTTMASKFDGAWNYVANAGWGVKHIGITEHTINNDVGRGDSSTAGVWRDDIRPYLLGLKQNRNLAWYLHYNVSDVTGASGGDAWVDLPQELSEFGDMAWEINTGEVL